MKHPIAVMLGALTVIGLSILAIAFTAAKPAYTYDTVEARYKFFADSQGKLTEVIIDIKGTWQIGHLTYEANHNESRWLLCEILYTDLKENKITVIELSRN